MADNPIPRPPHDPSLQVAISTLPEPPGGPVAAYRPAAGNENDSRTEVKVGPVEIRAQLPRWAIALLSILVIAGVTIVGYIWASGEIKKQVALTKSQVLVPLADMAVYQEQSFHAGDTPQLLTERLGSPESQEDVTLTRYPRDGCISIVHHRPGQSKPETFWIFGPGRQPTPGTSPKPVASVSSEYTREGTDFTTANARSTPHQSFQLDIVSRHRLDILDPTPTVEAAGMMGQCVDPHPGPFTFQNVPVNQCLVQVWRYFQDGCVHYQLYNPCTGMWDVYPNGAPRVNWTRCVH